MSCAGLLLLWQAACVGGMRTSERSQQRTPDEIQEASQTDTAPKPCEFDESNTGAVQFESLSDIFDLALEPWFIANFNSSSFHGERYRLESYYHASRATQHGVIVQLMAKINSANLGPECVRISSSPKCDDEGELWTGKMGWDAERTLVKAKTEYVPLTHQAIPKGDQAVGNWTASGLDFTISAAQAGGAPRLSITDIRVYRDGAVPRLSDDWNGDLGPEDADGFRSVKFAEPCAGDTQFKVRQLTGNSMEFSGCGYKKYKQFTVRSYDTHNVVASAFVCGRSGLSMDWVPLKGISWEFSSPARSNLHLGALEEPFANLYGPNWRGQCTYLRTSQMQSGWRNRSSRTVEWSKKKPAPHTSSTTLSTPTPDRSKAHSAAVLSMAALLSVMTLSFEATHAASPKRRPVP